MKETEKQVKISVISNGISFEWFRRLYSLNAFISAALDYSFELLQWTNPFSSEYYKYNTNIFCLWRFDQIQRLA